MRYYKKIDNDYILFIGTGVGGEEITGEEYRYLLSVIHGCPVAEAGYRYLLKSDLTWELVEAPAVDADPEISDAEALAIILGGDI